MADKTLDEWLKILTRRLDTRRSGVQLLRSYVDGNSPLPEMSRETVESWQHFQARSRTNWGELICDSVVDRVVPNGVTVGGDPQGPLSIQAKKIYRNNRMDSVIKEWLRYGLTFGQAYLTCWMDPENGPVITADSPETMCVVTNALQRWRPEAAIRVWRDIENERDYAIVWIKGNWQQFERMPYSTIENRVIPSKWTVNLAEGSWTPCEGEGKSGTDTGHDIPIVVYNNPGGHGEFETHLDLINRINSGILERLVIVAMQAFRQRAIKGGTLPEKDEQGNTIDYSKVFAPAPGCLWNIPQGLDIWESEQVDIGPILDGNMADIRQLSAVTRTPLPILMPDNTNQSAEGAKGIENGYIFRCKDRVLEAKLCIEGIMAKALLIDGATLADEDVVEVNFEPVDRVTLTEKYAAALAAHNAGESWKSIERNILAYTPEQIAQDTLDKTQEALLAASFAPRPPALAPAPAQQPQPKFPQQAGSNTKQQPTTYGGDRRAG